VGHEPKEQARNPAGGAAVLALVLTVALLGTLIYVLQRQYRDPDEERGGDVLATNPIDPAHPTPVDATTTSGQSQTLQQYHDRPESRLENIRHIWPELTEDEARLLMGESDRIQAGLEADGATDPSLQLRYELKQIQVSEKEAKEYYQRHCGSFGERTFEESRAEVDILVRLRTLRRQYSPDERIVELVEEPDREEP
jgi:hypothetical protein